MNNLSDQAGEHGHYPWHLTIWKTIQKARLENRLPHAILISGGLGTGLTFLATELAQSLLCLKVQADGTACQQCQSCRLFRSQNHPEFLLAQPEEDSQSIKVDQIRDLIQFTQLQARISPRKVVIINPAEKMNASAANSLLKTLEEPSNDTHLILVSYSPAHLPVTIRSRCQQFSVKANEDDLQHYLGNIAPIDLINSLQRRGLGPLYFDEVQSAENLQILRDKVTEDLNKLTLKQGDALEIAKSWQAFPAQDVFFWVMSIIEDTVILKSADKEDRLTNPDKIEYLRSISEHIDIKRLFKLYDHVSQAMRLAQGKSNVKAETLLEELTISWMRST